MIFEDNEKDNNDFDIPINSDGDDETSWDDLLDIEYNDSSLNEEIKLDEGINTDVTFGDELQIQVDNTDFTNNEENKPAEFDNQILSQEPDSNIFESHSFDVLDNIGEESSESSNIDITEGNEGEIFETPDQNIIENDLDNFLDLDNLQDQSGIPIVENNNAVLSEDDLLGIHEDTQGSEILENNDINLSDINVENISEDEMIDSSSSEYDMSDITGIAVTQDNTETIENSNNEDEIPPQNNKKPSKNAIIMGVGAAALLIVAIVVAISIFGKSFISSNDNQDQTELSALEDAQNQNLANPSSEPQNEDQLLQNMNNQGNIPLEEKKSKNEEKVVVSVTKTGRSNPFAPTGNMNVAGYTTPSLPNIAPPGDLNEDKEIGKLVEIVCTGILYDNVKPSAIITVGGVDYFVQKGDRVDKFIVSAITPTSVVIRNGKNAYVASIGQQFDVNDGSGKMKYVYNGKSKPVTRQYLSPSEVEIKVK